MRNAGLVFWVLFILAVSVCVRAEVGVSEDKILLGSSAAMSGANGFLGTQYHKGAKLVFDHMNSGGGIHGRKIEIKIYNDKYELTPCVYNTRKLIGKDKVFALFGYIGTPTTVSILKQLSKSKVPLFSAFTGAEKLRKPLQRYVINVRGSYYDETEGLVTHFMNDLGLTKIGIIYQDDAYGRAGYAGVKRALEKYGAGIHSEATYKRNTAVVKPALSTLKKSNPEAIICIGAYMPIAAFIKLAKESGWNPYFANISFVGSPKLYGVLGEYSEGLICSQVVPHLSKTELPLLQEHIDEFNKVYPDEKPDFITLEGYLAAKLLVKVLEMCGRDLTREGLIKTTESIKDLDFGIGSPLSFGFVDHQAMDAIYYTVVKDGAEIPLTDWAEQFK